MFGADGAEFDALVRQSQERVARIASMREQAGALTGTAETPDGRIKVTCTADDPLAELRIDPRAMRMASDDLAAAIRETARRALADRDRQVEKLAAQEYGDDNPLDLLNNGERLQQTLSEVQGMFSKAGRDARSLIDQLQQHLGGKDQPGGAK
nr:hypothetical protein GCM10010200_049430 [Actinomadura rugatobispora]